jgi:hypothetical protein
MQMRREARVRLAQAAAHRALAVGGGDIHTYSVAQFDDTTQI